MKGKISLFILGAVLNSFAVTRTPVATISGASEVQSMAAQNGIFAVCFSGTHDQIELYQVSTWNLLGTLTIPDSQSYVMSIAIQAGYIAAGAMRSNGSNGAVYIFPKGSGWGSESPSATLTQSDAGSIDHFGASVAVWGGNLVAGAPNASGGAGKAYVFTEPISGWTSATETAQLTQENQNFAALGAWVSMAGSMGSNGDLIALSGESTKMNGPGVIYLYEGSGGNWQSATPSAALSCKYYCGENAITENAAVATEMAVPSHVVIFSKPVGGWVNMVSPTYTLTYGRQTFASLSMLQNGQEITVCCGTSSPSSSRDVGYLWHSTNNWGNQPIILNAIHQLPAGAWAHIATMTHGWVFIADTKENVFIFNGN